MSYEVRLSNSAERELSRLDDSVAERIERKIEMLQDLPRPRGCEKLSGVVDQWRVRIGEDRIIYSVEDRKKLVTILAIRHRREVYRLLS